MKNPYALTFFYNRIGKIIYPATALYFTQRRWALHLCI